MKKIICFFIIFSYLTPFAKATIGNPALQFDLTTFSQNNNQNQTKDDNDGLSSGAITAITLGSIAGAGLLALGGIILKRKMEENLCMGQIFGSKTPLSALCLDKNLESEFYQRIDNNYPYLKKALSLSEIRFCPDSKYILIYDTKIDKKIFDSIRFKIPEGTKSLRIYFASQPYSKGEITQELYLSDEGEDFLKDTKIFENTQEGTSIHDVKISESEKLGNLIISNYSNLKTYAVAIELVVKQI